MADGPKQRLPTSQPVSWFGCGSWKTQRWSWMMGTPLLCCQHWTGTDTDDLWSGHVTQGGLADYVCAIKLWERKRGTCYVILLLALPVSTASLRSQLLKQEASCSPHTPCSPSPNWEGKRQPGSKVAEKILYHPKVPFITKGLGKCIPVFWKPKEQNILKKVYWRVWEILEQKPLI